MFDRRRHRCGESVAFCPRRISSAIAAAALTLVFSTANAGPLQSTQTYSCATFGTGCNNTIPAGAPVVTMGPMDPSFITVPPCLDCEIVDVNVAITITHSFRGDLDVTLTHVTSNTSLLLWSQIGSAGQNFDVTLDDSAAVDIAAGPCNSFLQPCVGTFRPQSPAMLSVFNGLNPEGAWRLDVFDNFGGDHGALVAWSLTITFTQPPPPPPPDESNIDPAHRFAWGENVGWTNWRDAQDGEAGVYVGSHFLTGAIWAENVGYIRVGHEDGGPYENTNGGNYGINVTPDGRFWGFGWGENVGWINFSGGDMASPPQPARVRCDGRLDGFVWGENIGWINLADATHFVALLPAFVPGGPCDMNGDGEVNGLDIQFFVAALIGGDAGWNALCPGDLVPNGELDTNDLSAFVECLLE
jgi:hypothetical protein